MFNEDIYSCKHWKYDEDIVHLKDFDHYKKYGKFFVVRYLNFGFTYLFFGKDDVYVALDIFENNIEKIIEEHFKTEIRNEIIKDKLKQLENYGNKI